MEILLSSAKTMGWGGDFYNNINTASVSPALAVYMVSSFSRPALKAFERTHALSLSQIA